jgi:hypothetical protein
MSIALVPYCARNWGRTLSGGLLTESDSPNSSLAEQGYWLIDGVETDDDAERALRSFGTLVRQYDGAIRNQVKAVSGYENYRYSKSVNTILVHSEAPGWNPPPRYLALHCRTQATCGGGHTDLVEAWSFIASLPDSLREQMRCRIVHWPGHNTAGVAGAGVRAPMIQSTGSGREIVRFSYNLLTRGHYDPPIDGESDPDTLPLGRDGVTLAERAAEFFAERRTQILIPEGSILIWDNQRMFHARSAYQDRRRHLTRYWLAEDVSPAAQSHGSGS